MKIYIVICAVICLHSTSNCQLIDKFGIKGGAIISNISTPFDRNNALINIFENQIDLKYYLSYDIGFFAEIFNKPRFGISVELHYNTKGESNNKTLKLLYPIKNIEGQYKYQGISDRFQYLSFQILPRWKFELNSSDKVYLFGGPKIDLLIGNHNSDGLDEVKLDNFNPEFGLVAGIGNEMSELFYLELKYEYSISNVYTIKYGADSYGRQNSSFLLLMGVSLKKLFRIHF